MIIILKNNTPKAEIDKLIATIESIGGISTTTIVGEHSSIIGLVGDTSRIHEDDIAALERKLCI